MVFEKHHHSFPACAPQVGLSPYRRSTCALGQAFDGYTEESSEEMFCPGLKEFLCQKGSGVALSPCIVEAPRGLCILHHSRGIAALVTQNSGASNATAVLCHVPLSPDTAHKGFGTEQVSSPCCIIKRPSARCSLDTGSRSLKLFLCLSI